jgi:hypothetical protein
LLASLLYQLTTVNIYKLWPWIATRGNRVRCKSRVIMHFAILRLALLKLYIVAGLKSGVR